MTGAQVEVANPWWEHAIARDLIVDIGGYEDEIVRLEVRDGRRVPVAAHRTAGYTKACHTGPA